MVTGDANNQIRFWNSETGELVRSLEGHVGAPRSLAFSPDGSLLLSGGGGDNEEVPSALILWDVETGTILNHFEGISGRSVHSVGFSSDGETAVSSSGYFESSAIQIWDVSTGALIRTIPGTDEGAILEVTYSPDGSKILSGGKRARLWDANSGQLLRTFDARDEVYSVSFAPDGKHILTGGNGAAQLWDIRDLLAEPMFIKSNTGYELHWELGVLQFSPDVDGLWTDLPVSSPFNLQTIGEKGFFRVKVDN